MKFLMLVTLSLGISTQVMAGACTEEKIIEFVNNYSDDEYLDCRHDARFEGAFNAHSIWIDRVYCKGDRYQFTVNVKDDGQKCKLMLFGIEQTL